MFRLQEVVVDVVLVCTLPVVTHPEIEVPQPVHQLVEDGLLLGVLVLGDGGSLPVEVETARVVTARDHDLAEPETGQVALALLHPEGTDSETAGG